MLCPPKKSGVPLHRERAGSASDARRRGVFGSPGPRARAKIAKKVVPVVPATEPLGIARFSWTNLSDQRLVQVGPGRPEVGPWTNRNRRGWSTLTIGNADVFRSMDQPGQPLRVYLPCKHQIRPR